MNETLKQAGEVVQSFVAINKILARASQQNAVSLGLTLPQMGILNTIYAQAGATLRAVTERLQLPKSTVSVAVDDLVNMGLVERKPAEDDRREIHLSVTAKGEELARRSCANASSYRVMIPVLEKLAEEEVQTLLCIHGKILTALEEYA